MTDVVYSRFRPTPGIEEALDVIATADRLVSRAAWPGVAGWYLDAALRRRGAVDDHRYYMREDLYTSMPSIRNTIGVHRRAWATVAEWYLDAAPTLNLATLRRVHELVAPLDDHRYRTREHLHLDVGRRELYTCPPPTRIASLLEQTLAVVGEHAVPIGNALLHLNLAALHPFPNGNTRVRFALSFARTISEAHPDLRPLILDAAAAKWDGMSSDTFPSYQAAWLAAAGTSWEPTRDVSSFIEWWLNGEARLLLDLAAHQLDAGHARGEPR